MDHFSWNDSLRGEYLWTNTNFGEAVTQPMSPLAWSVLRFTLDDWVFLKGYSTVGNLGGRPYLNISIFATLFNALGRSRQDLLQTMESTLFMRLPDEIEIPLIPASRGQVLASLPGLLRMNFKQQQGLRRLPVYLAHNRAWFDGMRARIQAVTEPDQLLTLWYTEIKSHIKQGVWCVLGSVNQSSNTMLKLRYDLEDLVGPEDANRLIANLSAAGRHEGVLLDS